MSDESIYSEEKEIWGHGDNGEVWCPELLLLTCHVSMIQVSEFVFPVAINIVEKVPRQQHSNSKPTANDVN